MKNTQELTIKSIEYKNDEKSRQNFIHFILNYLIDNTPLEKDDMHEGN